MAIDENLIPKDLRPLNVNRTVAGDDEPRVSAHVGSRGSRLVYYAPSTAADFSYASLGFVNPVPSGTVPVWASRPLPPPTISVAVAGPAYVPNLVSPSPELPTDEVAEDRDVSFSKKVKFLCSFGGKILPRPSDGALRYVGGQTRIISVRRDIGFQELMQKMVNIYGHPIVIKYQLPDEDLDALVSVSGKEDLDNMMEEYEKLVESSSEGSAKLRVFLFSALELDSPSVPQFNDFGDTGQRYVVAVNGIGEGPVGIRKRESTVSASSTHSEGPASVGEVADSGFTAVQGDDESLHPTNITSHEGTSTRLMSLGPNAVMPANPPPISTATRPYQTGSASRPEPESVAPSTAYLKPYTDPHQIDYAHNTSQCVYANSQTFGNPPPLWVTGLVYRENIAGVSPSHPLLQAVHLGHAPSSPGAGLKQNADQQFVQRMDTFVGDSSHGATRLVQRPTEQSYKILQPHIQLSAPLSGTPVEQYLWHPVAPSEQMVRLDNCYMCQKALPHAHSDTLLQDQASGLAKTISEPPEIFQSNHTEESMRPQSQFKVVVTGAMVDGATDQQDKGSKIGFEGVSTHPRIMGHIDPAAHKVAGNPQLGHFAYSQVPVPPGVRGFPGDGQAYGILVGNNVLHAHNADTASAATTVPLQTSEVLVRDYITKYSVKPAGGFSPKEGVYDQCFYYEHVIPVDSRLEALHLGTPDINGQVRSHIQPRNGFSKDLKPDNVPLGIESGNRMTEQFHVSNENPSTFVKPAIIPDVNYIKPIEAVSISSEFSTGLQNFQRVESNVLAHVSGNPGLPPQVKVDVGPSLANEMWHGKPMFSRTESTFVAADQIPRKNHADATSAAVSTPFSASNVSIAPVLVINNQDTASTNTLFSSQDPWNLIQQAQQAHFPSPRPVRVASKEALVQKDAGSDIRFSNNSEESNSGAGLNGALHQTVDTNRSNKGSAEELIKQDLKNVAEGVAASILQPSLQFGSVPLNHEVNLPVESVEEKEFSHNGEEVQKQDVKTKFMERSNPSNPSLLFTEDIGRLQIIKNNDLEELRELGSGTFGTVYHGKWRGTDVAIKRINDRCFAGKPPEQERLRADFWNEACKLADLHHPNVVAFYGIVLDGPGGSVATVTEYMVNGSLRTALRRNDRILDRRKRILIAMDVAFGMEYLHGKNIVHFDLKSDNLLVNLRDPQRPICKVGDLGLSKVKCQTLISGGVRGTLPWMAPELLNGSSSLVSEKVDVFSFGIVMWELLTGEEPFADLHYGAIIGGIVSNTLRPPVPESCDPEWKSLMEKCWASEPSERPSFTEIASKLRSMAAALPPKGQAQQASMPAQSQPQK